MVGPEDEAIEAASLPADADLRLGEDDAKPARLMSYRESWEADHPRD